MERGSGQVVKTVFELKRSETKSLDCLGAKLREGESKLTANRLLQSANWS